MPACGSEAACLKGLWTSKSSLASPQCLGSPLPAQRSEYASAKLRHSNGLGYPPASPARQVQPKKPSYLRRMLSSFLRVFHKILTYSILAPAVWLSAWLCLAWFFLQVPLNLLKFLLRFLRYSRVWQRLADERLLGGPSAAEQRCVLISGGSTVQAVQLARNLQAGGARVVVCELEGLFGLARFSRACARYYSLPRPSQAGAAAYVSGLKHIVSRERVTAYVPVSASSPAYFDSLAKPHLEMLGCECLVPGAAEVAILDDPMELQRRAQRLGLGTPQHELLASLEEAARLYENGSLRGLHYALPAGPSGLRERRPELKLPPSLAEFGRLQQQQQQMGQGAWLVVRDPAGEHFVTCTYVRDSRLMGSVTCRVLQDSHGLVLEERVEVNRWLDRFFSRSLGANKWSGHLSFRLASSSDKPDEVVGISCRVGVGLAYLAQSSLQASQLLRPARSACRHKQARLRQAEDELLGKTLDNREALFRYWDPLPYCVYCYLQLPYGRVIGALRAQQSQHKPPLAVVQ